MLYIHLQAACDGIGEYGFNVFQFKAKKRGCDCTGGGNDGDEIDNHAGLGGFVGGVW